MLHHDAGHCTRGARACSVGHGKDDSSGDSVQCTFRGPCTIFHVAACGPPCLNRVMCHVVVPVLIVLLLVAGGEISCEALVTTSQAAQCSSAGRLLPAAHKLTRSPRFLHNAGHSRLVGCLSPRRPPEVSPGKTISAVGHCSRTKALNTQCVVPFVGINSLRKSCLISIAHASGEHHGT